MLELFGFLFPRLDLGRVFLTAVVSLVLSSGFILVLTKTMAGRPSGFWNLIAASLRLFFIWLVSLGLAVLALVPFVYWLRLVNLSLLWAYLVVLLWFNLTTTLIAVFLLRWLDKYV